MNDSEIVARNRVGVESVSSTLFSSDDYDVIDYL
jgi:hypothetical protein